MHSSEHRRLRHRLCGSIAVALLFWTAQPASAAFVATEGFESYGAGSSLSGSNGGSGWTGSWTAVSGVTTETKHLQVGANDGQLQAARIAGIVSDSAMRRAFTATPATAAPVYLSVLLRLEGFESANADFVQFQVSNGAVGDNAATLSFGVGSTAANFFARVGTSASGTTNAMTSAANNTDYLLVAKFSADGAASYNRVDLYLNPTSDVESAQLPIATRIGPATGLSQLSVFNVRTARLTAGDDTAFLDNIRIGTSFADVVTPTPEPSGLVTMGIGVGVIGLYRRLRGRA
jgi:hypothetical protein